MEGRPCDVTDAVRGLVTVYNSKRWLVPPEERKTLLSPRNPLSSSICEGEWVRCRHGLYRGDIGLVCGRDPFSETEAIVAFIPRIPDKGSSSVPKRKRLARPEPQQWYADRANAMWGVKVRKISDEEYQLKHETYKSGLILKHLPPASVAIANAPLDIGPFLSATYVSHLPFYSSLVLRCAQNTIKVGQRVKVLAGEQQGLIGHPTDVSDGVATVVLQTNDYTSFVVSLCSLAIVYSPGDHVKHRFADSRGIVSSVDEEFRTVTFIEKDTNKEVCEIVSLCSMISISLQYLAHMDAIEPYTPALNFFRITPGLWVHFSGPTDTDRPRRRGYITAVEDAHAVVIDERTFTEVYEEMF